MLKTNLLAALTMSAALFFTACQKEQAESLLQSNNKTFPMPSNGGFRSLPTMPSVQNGMLKFTDQAHFNEYLAYLDALVMDEPQTESQVDTDTTEFDVKLLQVETNLSFNSLRAQLVADFEALNEEGFATLEEVPADHFVPSSSLRSILNENLEAKIGNSIFVYYNQDWLIEITDGDVDTRDEIRTIRKNNPNALSVDIYALPNVKMRNFNTDLTFNSNARAKCGLTDNFVNLAMLPAPECSNFDRTYLAIAFQPSADGCYYEDYVGCIDWTWIFSDGFVATATTCSPAEHQFTRTYPGVGNYSVTVTARVSGSNVIIAQNSIGNHLVGNSCSMGGRTSTTVWAYSASNNRAYSTQVRKYRGFGFITGGRYFNATTKSYRRSNSGTLWRHDRAERLAVQLWGAGRGDDCNNPSYDAGASWPNNARTAETTFYIGKRMSSNGDVYSNHRLWDNSVQYSQNRTLNVCP